MRNCGGQGPSHPLQPARHGWGAEVGSNPAAPSRWEILDMPREDVISHYRSVIDGSLPSCLKSGVQSIFEKSLPYVYYIIKRKCYRGVSPAIHICQKFAHSCVRNIVSFVRIPYRRTYRGVARCIQYVTQKKCFNSFSIVNMDWAPTVLKKGLRSCRAARLESVHV